MKLIILDRDGVINVESVEFIKSPEEWIPIPGSLEAIAALTQAGYRIAIATNQSGIARGLYDEAMLERIHDKLKMAVQAAGGTIDYIAYCPHLPEDNCDCRKPKPGMLLEIAKHFNLSLIDVPVVGDSYRDLEAARRVGAKPILVRTGNGVETMASNNVQGIAIYEDLAELVRSLTITP